MNPWCLEGRESRYEMHLEQFGGGIWLQLPLAARWVERRGRGSGKGSLHFQSLADLEAEPSSGGPHKCHWSKADPSLRELSGGGRVSNRKDYGGSASRTEAWKAEGCPEEWAGRSITPDRGWYNMEVLRPLGVGLRGDTEEPPTGREAFGHLPYRKHQLLR